jgi:hypothetical protein
MNCADTGYRKKIFAKCEIFSHNVLSDDATFLLRVRIDRDPLAASGPVRGGNGMIAPPRGGRTAAPGPPPRIVAGGGGRRRRLPPGRGLDLRLVLVLGGAVVVVLLGRPAAVVLRPFAAAILTGGDGLRLPVVVVLRLPVVIFRSSCAAGQYPGTGKNVACRSRRARAPRRAPSCPCRRRGRRCRWRR